MMFRRRAADVSQRTRAEFSRAQRSISGGGHTYSRGLDQYPLRVPYAIGRGKGPYVYDSNGQKYLDFGMALQSTTLGYSNRLINREAKRAIDRGTGFSRPSILEIEAAEALLEYLPLNPEGNLVKFGKNGSAVNTAAVKLARAATGRRIVCVPFEQPFFSYDDWFIGLTEMNRGIPPEHYKFTHRFSYGDLASLEKIFSENPQDVAAVILEPATHLLPCGCTDIDTTTESMADSAPHCKCEANFLTHVKDICRRQGAVLIFDEIRTGFRWHNWGAQHVFGVTPNLTTFGKALGNGYSVSCLVGDRAIVELGGILPAGRERVFLMSTTNGAETPGLAAMKQVLKTYETDRVCDYLWNFGGRLTKLIREVSSSHNIEGALLLQGASIAPKIELRWEGINNSLLLRTLFMDELAKRNVIFPIMSGIAWSQSHKDKELRFLARALDQALDSMKKTLKSHTAKSLAQQLRHQVQPVFRRYN